MSSEIEDLERAGWDALSGPDAAAFYDHYMADDGVMVFPGTVMDKDAALAAIATAQPWSSYELSDVAVIEASADAAVITHRATARRGENDYEAQMSSVYARRDGRWRLILHQQSPS